MNPDPTVDSMGGRHIPEYLDFPLHGAATMGGGGWLRLRRSAPRKPVS
jgi:hypothetical protein